MTKEKLWRLIQLTAWDNDDQMHSAAEECRDELAALMAEFEAWQPEAAPPRRPDPNVKPVKPVRIGRDY